MQTHPSSTWHEWEQPSPETWLPSSQVYPVSTLLFPYTLAGRCLADIVGAVPAAFYLACRRTAIMRCYVSIITHLILLQDISAGIEQAQPIICLALCTLGAWHCIIASLAAGDDLVTEGTPESIQLQEEAVLVQAPRAEVIPFIHALLFTDLAPHKQCLGTSFAVRAV